MRISRLSLVPVSVASVAVLFTLSACGGGGGGAGANQPPVTEQAITQASYGISQPLELIQQIHEFAGGRIIFSLSRGRQYEECPRVRDIGNGFELDFGPGCYSYYLDLYARGKLTVVGVGVEFDEHGEITEFDEIRIQLQDFATFEDGSYTGSFTIRNIGRDDAVGVVLSLRANHSATCSEQLDFNGTITYTEGWFDDFFTLQGRGTYQSSAYGRFSFEYNNLIYNSSCNYPVGGNFRVAAGSLVVSASFVESSCGRAFASLNNQAPVEVDLEELSDLYSPCGL